MIEFDSRWSGKTWKEPVARLPQLVEHEIALREIAGSNPSQTNTGVRHREDICLQILTSNFFDNQICQPANKRTLYFASQ